MGSYCSQLLRTCKRVLHATAEPRTHYIHRVNSLATLPGHEDVAGLTALLDPTTLPGRVARINLLTRGSNAMYLAMTPPRSPTLASVKNDDTDKAILSDSPVLVS